MIYLKIFLSLILVILPYAYAYHVRAKKKRGEQQSSLFNFLGKHLPKIHQACQAVANFIMRVYDGMKRSDSFRRFFTIVTLLVLLVYQYIDFHVASSIAHDMREAILDSAERNVEDIAELKLLLPYFTKPQATMLGACLTLMFFSYRFTDCLLTLLHNNSRLYCLVGLATMTLVILASRWFIIAETLAVILMAAYIYPDKRPIENPKGRKGIPKHERKKTETHYREAA